MNREHSRSKQQGDMLIIMLLPVELTRPRLNALHFVISSHSWFGQVEEVAGDHPVAITESAFNF